LAASIDEKFLHFIETVPDAMILSDQKGRIVLVNTNTERMFGYSRDELAGMEVEILIPERFQTRHREDRATYYADPRIRRMGVGRDLWACGKDGVEFPVEISLSPLEIRGKGLVWSAIRDISDRERSIAQLLVELHNKGLIYNKGPILRGLISICAWCKRMRDEGGPWLQLDRYIESHSQAKFTHGICKDCLRMLDPASHKSDEGDSPSHPIKVQKRRS
jgi:PAS domain S-box-containing protein